MTDLDVPDHSVAGILSWFSTIHLPPSELDGVLHEFRRLLVPRGVLIVGFFGSDDGVGAFDHKVITAYRWPVEVLIDHLGATGFVEVEHQEHQVPTRPDRKHAAVAARAC